MIPIRGNKTIGIKDVIARGITSVTHQIAIQTATESIAVVSGRSGFRSKRKNIDRPTTGPAQKDINCVMFPMLFTKA